jgi:hypothetical protein
MTNIEKVTHIMSYSNYGALAQMFVMDALHKWSGIISKTEPQKVDNGFVSGEAWIGVAREIQKAMQTEMSIDEAEFEEDETPSVVTPFGQPSADSNARFLAASYNAFDSAARRLAINAVEFSERMADGGIAELLEALDYLLEQTVDMDLKYGILLTEGEEDARAKALAIIAKAKGGAA